MKRLIEAENNDKIDIVDIWETEKSAFDLNNQPPTSTERNVSRKTIEGHWECVRIAWQCQ